MKEGLHPNYDRDNNNMCMWKYNKNKFNKIKI